MPVKLVMASYFETENHGSGRKIGISPGKPNNAECDLKFSPLDPGQLYWDYHQEKKIDPKAAGEKFVRLYSEQCQKFVKDALQMAADQKVNVFDVLPFKSEDTFLSWEKGGHMSFRGIAAEYLRELGYVVDER